MAELQTIMTPFSPNELAKTINANNTELDKRKVDSSVLDDFVTSEAFSTALMSLSDSISSIVNGTTVVAKARTLDPEDHPGNLKYFGTSEAGTLGWHNVPMPDAALPITKESFTDADSRWSGPVDGIHTLTFAHSERYALVVFKQINAGEFVTVSVDLVRDNTNIRVKSGEKFEGYVVLG